MAPAFDKEAAFVRKLVAYDERLRDKTPVRVLVLFGPESEAIAGDIAAAFSNKGFMVRSAKVGKDAIEVDSVDVLFLLAPTLSPALRVSCAKYKVLTVGTKSEQAKRGETAIALTLGAAKQQPLVNLARLKLEGHALSADFLSLATVVGNESDDFETVRSDKTKPDRKLEDDPWK